MVNNKPLTNYQIEIPVGETTYPHNTYILQHVDQDINLTNAFTATFTDELIRKMVDFIRGCGHHDDNIYSAMAEVAEEYFECKEKPFPVLPLQQNDLA
jgi:hypothetical protein